MNKKKSYQKPQVNRVKLAVDEAVLGACKVTASGSGPAASCCTLSATQCSTTTGS